MLTSVVGILLFGITIVKKQIVGVFVGLLGTLVTLAGMEFDSTENHRYAIFTSLSALGYAININIVKNRLYHLSSLTITTASFAVLLPALGLVIYSGFFQQFQGNGPMHIAIWYLLVLALLGTALANMLFNRLIHALSPGFCHFSDLLDSLGCHFMGRIGRGAHQSLSNRWRLDHFARGVAGQQKETLTICFSARSVIFYAVIKVSN